MDLSNSSDVGTRHDTATEVLAMARGSHCTKGTALDTSSALDGMMYPRRHLEQCSAKRWSLTTSHVTWKGQQGVPVYDQSFSLCCIRFHAYHH